MKQDSLPNENSYIALARKYRPSTFDDIIGQPILVKTTVNAIKTNRIPQAIILTGIRGVGKTTTARIIAKALNCTGNGDKPTAEPCGVCHNCVSIAQDRNPDVLEIDAASHTGVNDIREIIENVKYKPVTSRYKIYIIDEVHMLSNSAFNALLKTLEEPPAHVKFIFATTEIKKIPVTILSRCQRFDLKRVDPQELAEYYSSILKKEGFAAEENSMRLIAKVAEGSVRDGLSILDQAIAHSQGNLSEKLIREMVGLADQSMILDLFSKIAIGNVKEALSITKNLFDLGADPQMILQELATIVNYVVKIKCCDFENIYSLPEFEWNIYSSLAAQIDKTYLSLAWQIIMKSLDELRYTTYPFGTLELAIINLTHVTTQKQFAAKPCNSNLKLTSVEDLVKLCMDNNEIVLYHHIMYDMKIIDFSPPNISVSIDPSASKSIVGNLKTFLEEKTQNTWFITTVDNSNANQKTLGEQEEELLDQRKNLAKNDELVQDFMSTFENAKISNIETTDIKG